MAPPGLYHETSFREVGVLRWSPALNKSVWRCVLRTSPIPATIRMLDLDRLAEAQQWMRSGQSTDSLMDLPIGQGYAIDRGQRGMHHGL